MSNESEENAGHLELAPETSENYAERRQRLHNCTTFNVPVDAYNNVFREGASRLEQLPQEVLLVIKGFLSFKSRCCVALASKYIGNLILEPSLDATPHLQIYNHGHKEFFVNPPPTSPSSHNPTSAPVRKMTHVCGEYKDLLRTLSKDWNSAARRLCQVCSAWRPLSEEYWEGIAGAKCLDPQRTAAWVRGGEYRCPECDSDCRIPYGDIDGVSGMVSGVITG